MNDLFLEAAERMLVGLEAQASSAASGYVSVAQHSVRVKRFKNGFLYQSLGVSINAITRERAAALLAAAKLDMGNTSQCCSQALCL
jgi:hypothetical protein